MTQGCYENEMNQADANTVLSAWHKKRMQRKLTSVTDITMTLEQEGATASKGAPEMLTLPHWRKLSRSKYLSYLTPV